MGCGSSVVQDAVPAVSSSTSTGKPSDPHRINPSPSSSLLPDKKSTTSTSPMPCLSSSSFRRTSQDTDSAEAAAADAQKAVNPKGDRVGSAQRSGAAAAGSSNATVPKLASTLKDVDVDAIRDEIPMMESISGGSNLSSSSSSSDDFGAFNGLAGGFVSENGLREAALPPSGLHESELPPRRSVTQSLSCASGVLRAVEQPLPPSQSQSQSQSQHQPVGRVDSGRASVSLLSDSGMNMNQSFDGRPLEGSGLFEYSPRPTSGLATFTNNKYECSVCGHAEVAYVCEQCDACWCEDCRFKTIVLETHPPDHTINAINDGQHCNASRTFADSSFCSSDAVSSNAYGGGGGGGGGVSTLLYNPCSICAHSINDTDVVYRCGSCDFLACSVCFTENKAQHEHTLQRFQRRAKNAVQEKPLLYKKKTSDGNRIINEYVVVRLLGRGGNAKVKLVQHAITRQFYALKILKQPKATGSATMANLVSSEAGSNSNSNSNSNSGAGAGGGPPRPSVMLGGNSSPRATGAGQPTLDDMLREIAVMKFIDHPNIVQLKEVIEDTESKRAYIIMEYCERGAIYTHGDPPLPKETVKQYATDILRGLQHLHSQYLYHRDIKPANCLVDCHGTVKITDFGTTNSNITTGQTGTLAYCCPEERKGEAYTGDVKDSWAFAVTLYQLAYGRLPFAQLDYAAVRQALGSSDEFAFPFSPHVDPGLVDLLQQMLCKDRSRRMLISTASSHPYFIDSHECSLSTSTSPIAPGRQQLQRGSLLYGSGALVAELHTPPNIISLEGLDAAEEEEEDAMPDSEVVERHKELYERATASVVRGRNLLDAFHGTKSIQRIRQREQTHAQSSVLAKMSLAAALAATTTAGTSLGSQQASIAGDGSAAAAASINNNNNNNDLLQNGLDLLDSLSFGDDEEEDDVSQSDNDSLLQVDRSLPSLMSRSQSLPSTVRRGGGGVARASAGSAPVKRRLTFADSMTEHQQEVVLEMIRQYTAAPEKTRNVLRVTDVLMLSPPSEQVEAVASTVVNLHFSRTALANFGSIDLSSFNALKDITLSSNRLTEIPEAVLDAPRLLRLDLSNNRIRHVPASLRHARFLQRLNLHGNNISEVGTDADGHSYFSSTCLRHVRLSSNPIRALPNGLDTTTKLELVLDAIPALTEEWEQVVAQCRPSPPPAVITWDDSFPQKLSALPVAVWVATAALPLYRSHILKACAVRHVVLPSAADTRFPTGHHQSHTLETYFKRLMHVVVGMQKAEIVANSQEMGSGASPRYGGVPTASAATTMATASPEQTALAVAAVAESWAPLPSIVGKAARAYVSSYFFVSDGASTSYNNNNNNGGGVASSGSSLTTNSTGCPGGGSGDGDFEALREVMTSWLKAGESFLCFMPQASKSMHEELTATLGLALEDAFGQEWDEANFGAWLDMHGIM